MTSTGRCCYGIDGAVNGTWADVSLSGMEIEFIDGNPNGLSDRCCRFVGIVGNVEGDLSSGAMGAKSSCVSLGGQRGDGEWGWIGTCSEALNGGTGGVQSKGSDAGKRSGGDDSNADDMSWALDINMSNGIAPRGHCCRVEGTVGEAGAGMSSKVMEMESSCVSLGSRCSGVEWRGLGMVNGALSDGVGGMKTLSPRDRTGRSYLELEISTVEGEQRSTGKRS